MGRSKRRFTAGCPRCGGIMACERDTRIFETVAGVCHDCGFRYYTLADLLSLEEVNKLRAETGKEPLTERRPPQSSWIERFSGK